MGEALPAHRRTHLAAAAAFLPTLLRRQSTGPHTLIHQDARWRNFLCPKGPKDPTYLSDWQSWSVGLSPLVVVGVGIYLAGGDPRVMLPWAVGIGVMDLAASLL